VSSLSPSPTSPVYLSLFFSYLGLRDLLPQAQGLHRKGQGHARRQQLAKQEQRVQAPALEDEDAPRKDGDRGDDDIEIARQAGAEPAQLVQGQPPADEAHAQDEGGREVDIDHGGGGPGGGAAAGGGAGGGGGERGQGVAAGGEGGLGWENEGWVGGW
jgi:hypothetical protein